MTTNEKTTPPPAGARGNQAPTAWHTFWACFAGYMTNAMDVQLFIPAMQASVAIHGTASDVVLIATATLLSSALGGWIAGALSDRIGRVPVLQGTIVWLAVSTALCGVAQNYAELFAWRVLMGVGFGGQWAAAAVMVSEAVPPAQRGWWVGSMQGGWAVGWFLAAFLLPPLLLLLPADISWRAFFWVGALPALPILYYVRRHVTGESKPFTDTSKNLNAARKTADFLEIFSPTWLRTTVPACMLSIGAMGGYYAALLWLPTFLAGRLAESGSFKYYLLMLIAGSFAGYLASARVSDLDLRLFRRRGNFVLFAIGAIVTVFAHIYIPADKAIVLMLAFPLGFFTSGTFSVMGAFLTELFPTRMGGSGVGFTYNFGRGFAVLIVWLVGGAGLPQDLTAQAGGLSQGLLIALFVLIAYLLVISGALLLPETRGKELDTSAEDVPGARP